VDEQDSIITGSS